MKGADVVVIGAGPGGLATAGALVRRGLRPVVLERSDAVGSSWRAHYERLHLHTPRELSGLGGLPIPKRFGRWVARDDVVAYLELVAAHHELDIRTGVEVAAVERAGEGWLVRTASGDDWRAPHVVVATGYNHTPQVPGWPGLESFTGEVVHAASYGSGARFAGKSVLVVGIGNTGAEIATDLAEAGASPVWISVRTPPHILRRNLGPLSANHVGIALRRLPKRLVDALPAWSAGLATPDLREFGLGRPTEGIYTRVAKGSIAVQDVGIVDAIRSRRVLPVADVAGFEASEVVLADGRRIAPDVVVVATGYRAGLEPLVGHLGVLDARGLPIVVGGRPALPGLWFTGFTNPISGMFRELRLDAVKIARAIDSPR